MIFTALGVVLNANELTVMLEITGVKIKGGNVYIALYDNAKAFQEEKPCAKFLRGDDSGVVCIETRLSEGYWQVSVFQDENGNSVLDTGLFGIPKEPFGLSGYRGRGIPGNFDKLKIWVDSDTSIISVNLDYYRL